jgi:FMN phosphatase YigB (HAD superfamily)
MIPKAVVFDLGKVLVDFDYGIAARAVAARARISAPEVAKLIAETSLLITYETGGLATDAFYKQVCDATGFCGDLKEFGTCFGDIFTPIEAMIDLHARIRDAGVPTYIFSNTNELAIAHIKRTFPFFSTFKDYVYSFEEGALKPDTKIYGAVERRTRLCGGEILYIDDRPENIDAGKQRSWQAIHHIDPSTTRRAVAATGLPIQV